MDRVSNFKARLEEILHEKNIRAAQLSRDSGVNKTTICQYLKGVYEPKREQLCRMSNALGVTPEWLDGFDAAKYAEDIPDFVCRINVYSIDDLSTPIGSEVCNPFYKNCFYVLADEHLYPAVNKGDLVLLDKTTSNLLNGQAALISCGQYYGLYIYEIHADHIILRCLNGYFPPLKLSGNEILDMTVYGRVVMTIRKWQ